MIRTALVSVLRGALAVVYVVLLLVVELITAMLVYIYLNLNHLPLFGELVRFAKAVLDTVIAQLEAWSPALANAAFATLVGELGPKSILLLLIGLVAGVIVRFVVQLLARLISRKSTSPASEHA